MGEEENIQERKRKEKEKKKKEKIKEREKEKETEEVGEEGKELFVLGFDCCL